jgi:hypothetical protein
MKWILIIVIFALVSILVTRKKKDKKSTKTIPQPKPDRQLQQTYSTDTLDDKLREIESEITTDKKKYLQNCRNNYSEYVTAAQQLFADTYDKMEKVDAKGDPWTKYNSKAEQLKKNKDIEGEITLLEKAVSDNVYTPATYERLAILYSKKKGNQAAYNICKKWFDTDYWKIPNMASGSIRLLERMEKLEEKIKKNGG